MVLVVFIGRAIFANLNHLYKKNSASPLFNINNFYTIIGGLAAWLILLGALAKFNFFNDFSATPPHMLLVFVPPLIFVILLAMSKKISVLLAYVPAWWLVMIQGFRVGVEFGLWQLYKDGRAPVQMTFEGRNFDIITGITAIIIGYLIFKKKLGNKAIIAWNILGLALLVNIVITTILSLPLPFRQFMNEPSSIIITQYPFIWLPGFLVPFAYTMHILSIKKAMGKS